MRSRSLRLRVASFLCIAAACVDRPRPTPVPESVSPASGFANTELALTILGSGFVPRVRSDFDRRAASGVDSTFTAVLGGVPLTGVTLNADGTLAATLPAQLGPGLHALEVTDPVGAKGTLADAFIAIGPLAAFRFDPIAPQATLTPFIVRVRAVDALGNTYPFWGTATLTDLTGTVSPSQLGPFVDGSFQGSVTVQVVSAADALTVDWGVVTGTSNYFTVTSTSPTHLEFQTPPRQTTAGACSPAVVIEAHDALHNPRAPASDTSLAISTVPSLSLFADAACTTALGAVTIGPAAPTATLYYRGTTATTYTLQASGGPPLGTVSQDEEVLPGPPNRIVITSAAQTVPANGCSGALAAHLEDAWGNAAPAGGTTVSLTASPSPPFGFFSDGACSTPASSVTGDGSGNLAPIYFRSTAPGIYTLSLASSGLTGAQQSARVFGTLYITRGRCDITAGSNLRDCPLSLALSDLGKTVLFFEGTSNQNTPADSQVRCYLPNTGLLSCRRNGTIGGITLAYQILQIPSGLFVQHLRVPPAGPTTTVTLPTPVDPAKTFVLHSASNAGGTSDENDHRVARLVDSTTLELRFGTSSPWPDEYDVEVVQLDGATVDRGVTGTMANGQSELVVSGLPAVDLGSTFLLSGERFSDTAYDPTYVCGTEVRGRIDSPDVIAFTRGNGNGGVCVGPTLDAVHWERVMLGDRGRVQQVTVSMAPGVLTAQPTIQAVDLNRTIVLASSLWAAGQATGEAACNTDDLLGESLGRFSFPSSTTLQVDRDSSLDSATWTLYVVELLF